MYCLQCTIYFLSMCYSACLTTLQNTNYLSVPLSPTVNVSAPPGVRAVWKKIPKQEGKHKKQSNLPHPAHTAHMGHSSLYPLYYDSSGVVQLGLSVKRCQICRFWSQITKHDWWFPVKENQLRFNHGTCTYCISAVHSASRNHIFCKEKKISSINEWFKARHLL